MTKGEIVGNIFSLMSKNGDPTCFQDKYYKPTNIEDKYCKMEIVESIIFGFLKISLDTLYLKAYLTYISISNGRKIYMVRNIIPRPFQWYMELPLTP
jgi:hypothetical protein